jgi:hypothetical protein
LPGHNIGGACRSPAGIPGIWLETNLCDWALWAAQSCLLFLSPRRQSLSLVTPAQFAARDTDSRSRPGPGPGPGPVNPPARHRAVIQIYRCRREMQASAAHTTTERWDAQKTDQAAAAQMVPFSPKTLSSVPWSIFKAPGERWKGELMGHSVTTIWSVVRGIAPANFAVWLERRNQCIVC